KLSGDVTHPANALPSGNLKFDSADISTAAALSLAEATGAATANIHLTADGEKQNLDITTNAKNIKINQNHITSADIALIISDLFGVPVIDGDAAASDILIDTFGLDSFDLTANATGAKTDFKASTKLKIGTLATAS